MGAGGGGGAPVIFIAIIYYYLYFNLRCHRPKRKAVYPHDYFMLGLQFNNYHIKTPEIGKHNYHFLNTVNLIMYGQWTCCY